MHRNLARIRSGGAWIRLTDDRGMTLVEVMVAALLLVTAVLGTFGVIDTAARSTFRAEESQTVINIAQREIEKLRQIPYDDLAMSYLPTSGVEMNDPTARIRNTDGFCLEKVDGDDPCTPYPLVVNGGPLEPLGSGGTIDGGQVEPLSQGVQVGDINVDIYRFVVWQDEGDELLPLNDALCLDQPLHFLCKEQDYKRVVVAVRAHEAAISHERPYEDVQSDFIDPDRATLNAEPLGPGGAIVTGQQFWLSDTPCATVGEPDRQVPSNHTTHDTLGDDCDGSDRPDALLTDPPDDPDVADPLIPDFFDYSTDAEPCAEGINCDPDDKGLQMLEQPSSCSADPSGEDASMQIHRWVSKSLTADFVMKDKATLELWTRTIGDVQNATGEVCAFLFKRTAIADTTLATSSYASTDWPSGPNWSEARLLFDLDELSLLERTLLPTDRLGIAIGVDPGGTPDNVLQFLYDHPEGESRLEMLTTTPLP